MDRDELVKRYENETGNKFNVECVVYNEYAEWLEQNVVKLFAIPVIKNSVLCKGCGTEIHTSPYCDHCNELWES